MQYERVKPNVIYCERDVNEAEENIEGCFFALPTFCHRDIICRSTDAITMPLIEVTSEELKQKPAEHIRFRDEDGVLCRIDLPTWCYRFIDYREKPYQYLAMGNYYYKDIESYRMSPVTPQKLYSSYRYSTGWIYCALAWLPGPMLRKKLLSLAKQAAKRDKSRTFREHLASYVDLYCEDDMEWLKIYQSGEYITDARFIEGLGQSFKEYNED